MTELDQSEPLQPAWAHSSHRSMWADLTACSEGHGPTDRQLQRLVDWELSDADRAAVWSITAGNVVDEIDRRLALLRSLHPSLHNFPLPGAWTDWIDLLWSFWLPLAQKLDRHQRALNAPFTQGILGGQGTGKTTLTQILQVILAQLGHQTVALSIDDLYLTYKQRQALKQKDPRLIWRGPPGTHDIDLGLRTLKQLKGEESNACSGGQVSVPQFDKSLHEGQGDRTQPAQYPTPTIVLFEGWFVGVRPLPEAVFAQSNHLPEPIVSAADRAFARDCNRQLQLYLPLWDCLDSLMVLHPQDYRLSQRWRQQAEHKMKAQGKSGLSDAEINKFVMYFWKALHPQLFIQPLIHSPQANLIVAICQDHRPSRLYLSSNGNPGEIFRAAAWPYFCLGFV
ncbi:MAG: glycerate kinase [Phormidesmis sp.]